MRTPAERNAGRDFGDFFELEYPHLVRAVLLVVGELAEAEDLVQEAMARAFERWSRVAEMGSPSGYVYRSAINLHRGRLRHLRVRARRWALPSSPDPLREAERRSELARALASLPLGQRTVLVLVDWWGMTAEEAARTLDIKPSSVRSRLHRARTALRGALELEDVDE